MRQHIREIVVVECEPTRQAVLECVELSLLEVARLIDAYDALRTRLADDQAENERLTRWKTLATDAATAGCDAVVYKRFAQSEAVRPIIDAWKAEVAKVTIERDTVRNKLAEAEEALKPFPKTKDCKFVTSERMQLWHIDHAYCGAWRGGTSVQFARWSFEDLSDCYSTREAMLAAEKARPQ